LIKRPIILLLLGLIAKTTLVLADDIKPFTLDYKASYYKANFGNLDATAVYSLYRVTASNDWELESKIEVKLLGSTALTIKESSIFKWVNEEPVSNQYKYSEEGLNHLQRKIEFSANGENAKYTISTPNADEKIVTLKLTQPGFDNLNSSLVLRKNILDGKTDISLAVVDGPKPSAQHYQMIGDESIVTPVGTFNTIHLKRIRDSNRTTDIWLAPELDYAMVKLVQAEPNGDTINLQLKSGLIAGVVIK